MVEVNRTPMLEARYTPNDFPDYFIFFKAQHIKYYGKKDLDSIVDWAMRKIGLPNNRIHGRAELNKKVEETSLLVIFVAEKE